MPDIQKLKKEFQKVVKAYRDTLPNVTYSTHSGGVREERPEYPKAMLTVRQGEKRTATVAFGCWAAESVILKHRIDDFKRFRPFIDFCEAYDVMVGGIERDSYGYASMRLTY